MDTKQRWEAAQTYERSYWENAAQRIETGSRDQFDWYGWRADQLAKRLRRLGLDEVAAGNARVLEVGSGPVGVASYFPGSERVAVDPLADFYGSNPVLSQRRNPSVRYVAAKGEALPEPDAKFDLTIIENCIDHVQTMPGVMAELRRCTRPGGLLYLTVNCRTPVGYWVHRFLSRTRIDAGHPYTFTPPRARALIEHYGFDVLDVETGSYTEALREDLRGPGARQRLKAVLGVSEFITSVIARRRADR